MRDIKYFYQKGQITSSNRLSPPNPSTPMELREKLLEMKGFDGYFKDYTIYLTGSLVVGYENPKDMDIMVTGKLGDTYKVYELLNIISSISITSLQTFTDVFYVRDISFLDLDPKTSPEVKYECLTGYSMELEIVDNQITRFRDFSQLEKVGLLTKHTLTYPSEKQIQRGYEGKKYRKIF